MDKLYRFNFPVIITSEDDLAVNGLKCNIYLSVKAPNLEEAAKEIEKRFEASTETPTKKV